MSRKSRQYWDGVLVTLITVITVIGIMAACNLGAYAMGWIK